MKAVAWCLLSLGVLAHASSALAASTSPGKRSAYESTAFNPLPVFPTPLLTATIEKGKKKHVLEILTTLSTTSGIPTTLAGGVTVNGIPVEPGPGWITAQDCSGIPAGGCDLTSVRWLDLDAAELINPGTFIGQPLNVVFQGGAFGAGVGGNSAASMAVRLEKK